MYSCSTSWLCWKLPFFAHLPLSIFLYPHPSIQKLLLYKESSYNALNICGYKNWIGGLGICKFCENNILIFLISKQKLFFGDDDAIYDVIIKNQFENDVITRDMKSAGIHLLNYQSFRHTQPFLFLDESTGPNSWSYLFMWYFQSVLSGNFV